MSNPNINEVRKLILDAPNVTPNGILALALVYVGDAIREATLSAATERAIEQIPGALSEIAEAVR